MTLAVLDAPDRSLPRSLRDEAYETIKARIIIMCLYRPGEVLSEAAVSSTLGIGRHAGAAGVRPADARRPRGGVAAQGHHRAAHLAGRDRDMVEVRLLNEGFCARLAAQRATAADIAALEANVARGVRASAISDIATLMALDREFHAVISGAAGNPILGEILRTFTRRRSASGSFPCARRSTTTAWWTSMPGSWRPSAPATPRLPRPWCGRTSSPSRTISSASSDAPAQPRSASTLAAMAKMSASRPAPCQHQPHRRATHPGERKGDGAAVQHVDESGITQGREVGPGIGRLVARQIRDARRRIGVVGISSAS